MAVRPPFRFPYHGATMSNAVRLSIVISLAFLVFELTARWGARTGIEAGSTIPLFGKFYLTNAIHPNSVRGLGLTSETWLFMALAICLVFVASSLYLARVAHLQNNPFTALGSLSSFVLLAVVVANLLEALWLDGVTDYLALVDIDSGRAHVINLGDVLLALTMGGIVISAIGTMASLIVSAVRPTT